MVFATSLFLFVLSASTGVAVPFLQLYSDGSEYNTETESWLTYDNPFTLQVLGASHHGNITEIRDLLLFIAVPQDWWSEEVSITIMPLSDPGTVAELDSDDFSFVVPDELPPHGIYPAYCYNSSGLLPDMVFSPKSEMVDINNYTPEGHIDAASDLGIIYEYEIGYSGISGLNIDSLGTALDKKGKEQIVFAPFSHNADAVTTSTPEPNTLILLGMGLIGLVGILYRRKQRRVD
jgi:hypothetical protein